MGDSALVLQDNELDILAVTHDTAGGNLTTAIKVAKLLATGRTSRSVTRSRRTPPWPARRSTCS